MERPEQRRGILNKNLASIRCYQTTKLLLIFPVTKNHYTALHKRFDFKLQPNLFIAPKYPHAKLDTLFFEGFSIFPSKDVQHWLLHFLSWCQQRKKKKNCKSHMPKNRRVHVTGTYKDFKVDVRPRYHQLTWIGNIFTIQRDIWLA